jgi:hypothetical protein
VQNSAAGVLSSIANGSAGQVLTMVSGAPAWAASSGAVLTRINASSGAAGVDLTWQKLSADAAAITSTTPSAVMTTTGLSAGVYSFKYHVRYQSAATTTGLGTAVNYTGTSGAFLMITSHVSTGTTGATGISDQVNATNAGQLVEGKAERVKNTVTSTTAGVDTASADQFMIVQGTIEVTGAGNLELKISTEVSGSGITVKAGTLLELNKIG